MKELIQESDAVHAEKNIQSILENHLPKSEKRVAVIEFIIFLVDYILLGISLMSRLLKIKSGGIASDDCEFLYKFCQKNRIRTILEFGPGSSTSCFLKLKEITLTSFEHDEGWLELARERFKEYKNVNFFKFENRESLRTQLKGNFDLSFVDTSLGNPADSRRETCIFASQYTDLIILHDSKRAGEKETIKHMETLGWKSTQINTKKGLCILRKN